MVVALDLIPLDLYVKTRDVGLSQITSTSADTWSY